MPFISQNLANLSLTDKSLSWLIKKNKSHGAAYSFSIVHVLGSGLIVGAGLADTGLQTVLAIVKFITGLGVSPFNFFAKALTGKSFLKEWGWTMAINHLAHAIKHLLSTFFIAGGNFFVGPEDVHNAFFKEVIEYEKRLSIEMKTRTREPRPSPVVTNTGKKQPAVVKKQPAIGKKQPAVVKKQPVTGNKQPVISQQILPPPQPPKNPKGPPPPPPLPPSLPVIPKRAADSDRPKMPVLTGDRLQNLRVNLKPPKPQEVEDPFAGLQNAIKKLNLSAHSESSEENSDWDDSSE